MVEAGSREGLRAAYLAGVRRGTSDGMEGYPMVADDYLAALGDTQEPRPEAEGFVRCPLCGDPERTEDIVGGVCLTCADGIAFAQNARRGSIVVAAASPAAPETPR